MCHEPGESDSTLFSINFGVTQTFFLVAEGQHFSLNFLDPSSFLEIALFI